MTTQTVLPINEHYADSAWHAKENNVREFANGTLDIDALQKRQQRALLFHLTGFSKEEPLAYLKSIDPAGITEMEDRVRKQERSSEGIEDAT